MNAVNTVINYQLEPLYLSSAFEHHGHGGSYERYKHIQLVIILLVVEVVVVVVVRVVVKM